MHQQTSVAPHKPLSQYHRCSDFEYLHRSANVDVVSSGIFVALFSDMPVTGIVAVTLGANPPNIQKSSLV